MGPTNTCTTCASARSLRNLPIKSCMCNLHESLAMLTQFPPSPQGNDCMYHLLTHATSISRNTHTPPPTNSRKGMFAVSRHMRKHSNLCTPSYKHCPSLIFRKMGCQQSHATCVSRPYLRYPCKYLATGSMSYQQIERGDNPLLLSRLPINCFTNERVTCAWIHTLTSTPFHLRHHLA